MMFKEESASGSKFTTEYGTLSNDLLDTLNDTIRISQNLSDSRISSDPRTLSDSRMLSGLPNSRALVI